MSIYSPAWCPPATVPSDSPAFSLKVKGWYLCDANGVSFVDGGPENVLRRSFEIAAGVDPKAAFAQEEGDPPRLLEDLLAASMDVALDFMPEDTFTALNEFLRTRGTGEHMVVVAMGLLAWNGRHQERRNRLASVIANRCLDRARDPDMRRDRTNPEMYQLFGGALQALCALIHHRGRCGIDRETERELGFWLHQGTHDAGVGYGLNKEKTLMDTGGDLLLGYAVAALLGVRDNIAQVRFQGQVTLGDNGLWVLRQLLKRWTPELDAAFTYVDLPTVTEENRAGLAAHYHGMRKLDLTRFRWLRGLRTHLAGTVDNANAGYTNDVFGPGLARRRDNDQPRQPAQATDDFRVVTFNIRDTFDGKVPFLTDHSEADVLAIQEVHGETREMTDFLNHARRNRCRFRYVLPDGTAGHRAGEDRAVTERILFLFNPARFNRLDSGYVSEVLQFTPDSPCVRTPYAVALQDIASHEVFVFLVVHLAPGANGAGRSIRTLWELPSLRAFLEKYNTFIPIVLGDFNFKDTDERDAVCVNGFSAATREMTNTDRNRPYDNIFVQSASLDVVPGTAQVGGNYGSDHRCVAATLRRRAPDPAAAAAAAI